MQKLLKIGLLSSVSLFLSLVGFMASSGTSYAINSQSLSNIDLLPGLSMSVLPDTTPTPTPTPTPASTPAATQSPQAKSTSQASPVSTRVVFSNRPVKAMPAPSRSSAKNAVNANLVNPSNTVGAAIPVSITVNLPDKQKLNIKIYKLFLVLGVDIPLLLIGVGTLYLLIKSWINQRRLAS